jgi:hypothetical protein
VVLTQGVLFACQACLLHEAPDVVDLLIVDWVAIDSSSHEQNFKFRIETLYLFISLSFLDPFLSLVIASNDFLLFDFLDGLFSFVLLNQDLLSLLDDNICCLLLDNLMA